MHSEQKAAAWAVWGSLIAGSQLAAKQERYSPCSPQWTCPFVGSFLTRRSGTPAPRRLVADGIQILNDAGEIHRELDSVVRFASG